MVTWLALSSLCLASSALAQGATPQERERARGLLDRGDQLTATGDHQGALDAYTAADDIMGVPTTGIEVGRAQRALGLLLEARDTWIQVTRYPVTQGEPAPFTKARQEAARLASEVAQIIPTISIHVDGAQQGAFVLYLDDAELTPASVGVPLRVNPGKHVVHLEAEGHEPSSTEISMKEGESPEITLRPGPASSKRMNEGQLSDNRRSEGRERSTSSGSGSVSFRRTMAYIGLGVGAVGISLGSVFGGISIAQASRAKDQCAGNSCPVAAEDEIQGAKRTGTISTVAFIVGGIGAAGGLYFLLTPGREREPRASGVRSRQIGARWESLVLHSRGEGAELTVGGVF